MEHHEVTTPQPLLNKEGNIAEPGYAKKFVWEYRRADITAPRWRIKEWDYYYIGNKDYGIAVTISDSGFIGVLGATVFDFRKAFYFDKSGIKLFPLGKMQMPETTVKGDVAARAGKVSMSFTNDGVKRVLTGNFPNFMKGKTLKFDITLTDFPEESLIIATPFAKKEHFYFNNKINCMRASGGYWVGEEYFSFDNNDSLGTIDWGRGVWTYSNTWYWGSLQTMLADGSTFGFNIGYGFGDTSAASENMLFYNGKAHKIDLVDFGIPGDAEGKPRFLEQWKFTSSDGRLEMDFKPILNKCHPTDIGVVCMRPNQVFGRFTGTATLDDGTVITLNDVPGFAEKVHNQW